MATVAIALGSNLGDRLAQLETAQRRLTAVLQDPRRSTIFETEPVGYLDQNPFLNAVLVGSASLSPLALLQALQRIEREQGRERSFPNAPRTIDLDLLLYDDVVLDTPALTLPHPRLHERFFVLVPLVELAPDLRHPRFDRPLRDLLHDLGPPRGLAPYAGERRSEG